MANRVALNLDVEKPQENVLYKRGYSRFIHHIFITGDLIFLNVAFWLSYALRYKKYGLEELPHYFTSLDIVFNLAWVVIVYLLNIYAVSRVIRWETISWNIVKAILAHLLIVSVFVLSTQGVYYSKYFFLLFYSIFSASILSWRIFFVHLIRLYRENGYNFRNVVVVGDNKASAKICKFLLSEKSHGFKLKAVFGDDVDDFLEKEVGSFPESLLYEYLDRERVDEIYCALPLTSVKKIRSIMSYAENNLIRFRYVPDLRALLYKKVDIEFYGVVPVLSVRTEPLENIRNQFIKRTFDLVFSIVVLTLLVPTLFPIIAFLIKVTSKGPVLFVQKRSGRNNEVFRCYKFRTMYLNSTSDIVQATKMDTRVTPIGKFLRKTNLDELPQFYNVMINNMSVVGPRPHMLKHTEEYRILIDKFMIRHLVKPGITGWAQVNGLRGSVETPQKMIKRTRADVWYIENWSLLMDIKIIFMTVFNMFKGEKNAF
jgi:Undecaprenyl-phosphate glucose phosphotransferase